MNPAQDDGQVHRLCAIRGIRVIRQFSGPWPRRLDPGNAPKPKIAEASSLFSRLA
jgi:hypothetical protein